jgi:hypothetical protein
MSMEARPDRLYGASAVSAGALGDSADLDADRNGECASVGIVVRNVPIVLARQSRNRSVDVYSSCFPSTRCWCLKGHGW